MHTQNCLSGLEKKLWHNQISTMCMFSEDYITERQSNDSQTERFQCGTQHGFTIEASCVNEAKPEAAQEERNYGGK
jgi:hypothetical protein